MSNPSPVPHVHAPGALAEALAMVQQWLEQSVAAGLAFQHGETVDVGWLPFQVSFDSRGLRVSGPRIGSPMAFVDDCSMALNLLAAQQYLLDSFGAESGPCHAFHTALVVNDLLECPNWYIDRLEPTVEGHSGWYFGGLESQLDPQEDHNVGVMTLWDLFSYRPYIGPFLQLPVGWQVSFEERPLVSFEYEPVAPYPKSFYTQQYGVS